MYAKWLNIAFIFSLFVLATNSFGQLSWQQLNTNTNENLHDSYFVDANKGYAVGANGTIVKTLDGGLNWIEIGAGNSAQLFGVHFVSPEKGWVVGTNGTVLKTGNGGGIWSAQSFPVGYTFYDIHFVNDSVGWIAGSTTSNTSIIYKTTNGGNTWNPVGGTLAEGVKSIDFFNENFGMAVTNFNAYVTIDGGNIWAQMTLPTTAQLARVETYTYFTAWIVGASGLVLKTIDGGTVWNVQSSPAPDILWDISTIDGNNLYAVGYQSGLIITNNSGATWNLNSSLSATDSVYSIFSVNATTHYITAENGIMYKSIANYDLSISDYLSPTLLCPNQTYPISIVLESVGPSPATSATITVLKDGSPHLTYSWLGNLSSGMTEVVHLGYISIDSETLLSIVLSGDDNNANNTLLQTLSVHDLAAAGTNDKIFACMGEPIQLEAFGGISYLWYNASSDSTSQNQNIVATSNAIYYVDIKQNQCTIFDSVVVVLQDGCTTNAFSPNNDAVNDYFIIDGLSGPSKVIIYNRWGDEIIIFENYDNVNVVWDGTDGHGKNVTEGTYFYAVDTGSSNPNSGWVQVIR